MPVQEATSCRLSNHDFPRADHLKLLVPVVDLVELARGEDISVDQVDALLDHSLSKGVVASFVALNDVHHELHHVVLYGCLLFVVHRVHFLHASLDLSEDELASVAIDQDDPLVDQELLCLELDFDCLEHFNGLDDDREGAFRHGAVGLLEEKQVKLE